ncbi:hypothetical protein SM12BL3_38820 [Serratia marcescens]|nr:hypothetical protein SM12BL3_38820 [Serratia marcescens]
MRELNVQEVEVVNGATLDGAIWGIVDGAATGMSIGGKWGGAGGWGFGALSQLVGIIVPTAMGAVAGGVTGLLTDRETAANMIQSYRETFGPGSTNNGSLI